MGTLSIMDRSLGSGVLGGAGEFPRIRFDSNLTGDGGRNVLKRDSFSGKRTFKDLMTLRFVSTKAAVKGGCDGLDCFSRTDDTMIRYY